MASESAGLGLGSLLGTFVLGAAVGATIALLTAPGSGAETRERLKSKAMIRPIPMPKANERNKRAKARSGPITPPVYTRARMLAAGAKNRKVSAGPKPAPFL